MTTLGLNLRSILISTSASATSLWRSINGITGSVHTSAANYDWNVFHLCKPPSLNHKLLRKVYYPEKYTVEPLKNDHLAGRDPNTGETDSFGFLFDKLNHVQ